MTTEKHQPIIWLKELNLNTEQIDLIAMLINIFGDDMHPFADRETINGFSVSYLKEILSNEGLIKGKAKQAVDILAILESVEKILEKY